MPLSAVSSQAPICPLTGTPMTSWLHVPCDWRRPDAGGAYHLFWSPRARFGQLYPRPSPAEVASFYDIDYYTHDGVHESEAEPPAYFLERLRVHLAWRADRGSDLGAARLRALLPGRSPAVLDLGCGDGELLADLAKAGCETVGVEPDGAARRVAAGRWLEVYAGTAERLPSEVSERWFDMVVFNHVLEHCLEPFEALRSAAARLKPGGLLVAETPNNEAAGCRTAGAAWPWLDVPRHLNFFTTHSLRQACLVAGLTPTATEYCGYTRQFQGGWLEMERRIRDTFPRQDSGRPPNLSRRAWGLLIRTALGGARFKYDSVRVVARKPLDSRSE